MNDREFLAALDSCTLPALSHRDHIRTAWLILQETPLADAIQALSLKFQSFAASKGHADHFHETITWALTIAINERIHRGRGGGSWQEFLTLNPELNEYSTFLNGWYSEELLKSDVARKCFVMPDNCRS